MRTISTLLLLLFATLTSCQAPAWRAEGYGPDAPTPTLITSSVFTFHVPAKTVDVSGMDLGDLAKGIGNWAKNNPDEVVKGAIGMVQEGTALHNTQQAIRRAGDAMHAESLELLARHGFQAEFDPSRAQKHADSTYTFDYAYVAPRTVASPFGAQAMAGDTGITKGNFPIFGTGSKSNVAEALRSGRSREGFASIQGVFMSSDPSLEGTVECHVVIQVLNEQGELVFEGIATGSTSSGSSANERLMNAFRAAMGQIKLG